MGSGGLIGFLFLFLSLLAAVFEWMRRESRSPLSGSRADNPPDPKHGIRQL